MSAVILVLATDDPPAGHFDRPVAEGRLTPIRQDRLGDADIGGAAGLLLPMSVDQIDLHERRPALAGLLARGGRIALNGHVMRPFIDGLETYVPLRRQKIEDVELKRLADHPVFAGIEASSLLKRRGVAGFYGRGHNPPPNGAIWITGIGLERLPVDWEWRPRTGGALFVHAGNDLWGTADDNATNRALAERLVDWCEARS